MEKISSKINGNFGLWFDKHNYSEQELLDIMNKLEKRLGMPLSSSYQTTLVGNFTFNDFKEFDNFCNNTMKSISKEYNISIVIYIENGIINIVND